MGPLYNMMKKKDKLQMFAGTLDEMAYRFEDASPYFQRAVVVAEYAEILKESYWAEENTFSDVFREAQRIAELLYHDETMQEFVDLVHKAMHLWE